MLRAVAVASPRTTNSGKKNSPKIPTTIIRKYSTPACRATALAEFMSCLQFLLRARPISSLWPLRVSVTPSARAKACRTYYSPANSEISTLKPKSIGGCLVNLGVSLVIRKPHLLVSHFLGCMSSNHADTGRFKLTFVVLSSFFQFLEVVSGALARHHGTSTPHPRQKHPNTA